MQNQLQDSFYLKGRLENELHNLIEEKISLDSQIQNISSQITQGFGIIYNLEKKISLEKNNQPIINK